MMCESRKMSTLGHVVDMIKNDDVRGLRIYHQLIREDEFVVIEIKEELSVSDSEVIQLIKEKAPEFMQL